MQINPLDLYRTELGDLLPPADPLDPAILRAPAKKASAKRSKISPTQRSLKHLREAGYLCQVTEVWNNWSRTRTDLFGVGDILAIRSGEILMVQATSRENVPHRVNKIAEHENTPQIRKAGIRLVVHGWGKMASGKWELREVDCS